MRGRSRCACLPQVRYRGVDAGTRCLWRSDVGVQLYGLPGASFEHPGAPARWRQESAFCAHPERHGDRHFTDLVGAVGKPSAGGWQHPCAKGVAAVLWAERDSPLKGADHTFDVRTGGQREDGRDLLPDLGASLGCGLCLGGGFGRVSSLVCCFFATGRRR